MASGSENSLNLWEYFQTFYKLTNWWNSFNKLYSKQDHNTHNTQTNLRNQQKSLERRKFRLCPENKKNTGGFQQKQISLKPLILCTWNFGGILAIANGLSRPNFMPSQQGNQQLHLNRRNSRKLQRRLTKSKLLHGLKSFANEILQLC